MTSTARARRAVWNLIFKTDTFRRFNSSFMLHNFMQKFAHFLKNCWTVLSIKFFKLPHPHNTIIDNVLGIHFLSGHSVVTRTVPSPVYRSAERMFPVGTFSPRSENTGERKVPEPGDGCYMIIIAGKTYAAMGPFKYRKSKKICSKKMSSFVVVDFW